MFQSDVQDFCHHKTGEYTVAINVLNNWDLNFTFNVVTILLKSATDRIILFETLILKLKISIVVTCSSYKVKKKRNLYKNYGAKKGTQQHQCFSTEKIGSQKRSSSQLYWFFSDSGHPLTDRYFANCLVYWNFSYINRIASSFSHLPKDFPPTWGA